MKRRDTQSIMKQLSYLRSLFAFAFQNNSLLSLSIVVSAFSVGLELAAISIMLPLATSAAGGAIAPDSAPVRLMQWLGLPIDGRTLLLAFIGLFILRIATQLVSQALTIYVGRRLLLQLTARAFSVLVRNVSILEIERKSIGYFITLAGDEANRSSNLVVFISQLFSLLLLGLVYFAAIVVFSPLVAAGVVAFSAIAFLALFESFRISHRLGIVQIEQSQALNSLFLDSLNGLRVVRSFSAQDYVVANYYNQLRAYVRTLAIADFIGHAARLGPALFLLLAIWIALVVPLTPKTASIDLPFAVTMLVLLMRFFPIVGQTLNGFMRVVSDARAGKDVTEIIARHDSVVPSVEPDVIGTIEHIEATGLQFSHVGGKLVLAGLSLNFVRGKSYAIVGASGSGKSTFLDLLLGFYPLERGRLLLNGVPIEAIPPNLLRRRALLFGQDVAIFNDTVANNLRLGHEASDEEIAEACRIAGIEELIAELPDGLETKLAYRGGNLSGGQRQRIGIARAVLRKPDVLLLDESTSALDSATREKVVCNLLEAFKDRIIVFVTHDDYVKSRVDHVLDMAVINRMPSLQDGHIQQAEIETAAVAVP